MKKLLTTILKISALLIVVGFVVAPEVTHAQWSFINVPIESFVNTGLANLLNWFLKKAAVLVYFSGVFLSYSINITTHIADLVASMPSLGQIWIVVRNLTSMFVIFMLLFASLKTILGVGSSELGSLVVKIFIAGVLINFSLFFAKVAIDTSNLVSLQFYRAIAPTSAETKDKTLSWHDGDLSLVFMNNLKIQKIYQAEDTMKGAEVALSISIAALLGIIMMITAAISFTAAAVMFTARTGILLFCMVLSPIYFAAQIFPQLKDKSKTLLDMFIGQLTFMPMYLFLMYITLRLISSDGFNSMFNEYAFGTAGNALDGSIIAPTLISTVIQYTIALIFINAPLAMAVAAGGVGGGWAVKMTENMNGWLQKRPGAIGGSVGASAWRNTGGRIASRVAQSESVQNFAGKNIIGEQFLKSTRGIAKDYNTTLDKRIKDREETYKSFSGKDAKANYVSRLSKAYTTAAGRYSMGTLIGRADRVGAASLLTTREKEIKEEINKLQKRKDELLKIQGAHRTDPVNRRALDPLEVKELDDLTKTDGDIAKEKEKLNDIKEQARQFQIALGGQNQMIRIPGTPGNPAPNSPIIGGATPKDVTKRKY